MSTFGKAEGGGRRSAPRAPAPLVAVFNTVTHCESAIVIDVSATGVRLSGENFPRPGELLEVVIATVRAFGIVMWSRDGECGVEFDPPLTPTELNRIRIGVTTMAGLPPQVKVALEDWESGFAR